MRAPPCLETARLHLRPRRREDIDAILQMDLDPEVYRYSEMRAAVSAEVPDRAALRKNIRLQILSGTPREFWVVEWKGQPGFLGLAGLAPVEAIRSHSNGVGPHSIGFRFVRTAWGQGIATETARAILDFGFRVLKCPTVFALSHTENGRSGRVLEKIGMERDRNPIGVVRQPSLLSASQSPPSPRVSSSLMQCSPGNIYLFYRLERGTYLDRASLWNATEAQPNCTDR